VHRRDDVVVISAERVPRLQGVGEALIAAMQASPHRDRAPVPVWLAVL
jgi:hypothetical protein